jgi:hypothetical protein
LKQKVVIVLQARFEGRVDVLVAAAEGSAARLIRLLATHFLSYRDGRAHLGRHVWFLKRAQIFVADVWAAFEGKVRDKNCNGILRVN